MAFVELQDVYKRYRTGEIVTAAADGVNFHIEQGEFAIIVGPSGAGKTTVLNMLGGMDTCDEGRILVDGQDIAQYNNKQLITYRRHDIGFVFQFYNLVQNLTARENVELAAQICRDPMDADEALAAVGLSHRLQNFPAQLSGGEQQRVSVHRIDHRHRRGLFRRPHLHRQRHAPDGGQILYRHQHAGYVYPLHSGLCRGRSGSYPCR